MNVGVTGRQPAARSFDENEERFPCLVARMLVLPPSLQLRCG